MKMKLLVLFVVAGLAGLLTGCVETLDGRSETGAPFVKDQLSGRYERTTAQVLDAAKFVINKNGKLSGDNTVNNTLQGTINTSTVWVKVEQIDASKPITQITVQARTKARDPDIDLAHEVEKQVALYLQSH